MPWIDIIVGAIAGLLIAFLCARMFTTHPKIAAVIILIFAILGVALSDEYLTPKDKRWNILYKMKMFFTSHLDK